MKKIVRLTESELKNVVEASVRRAIQEGAIDEGIGRDLASIGGTSTLAALALLGGKAALPDTDPTLAEPPGAFQAEKDEFGDRLKPANSIPSQNELPSDTISWKKANKMESRIRRAVMESIRGLMMELSDDTYDEAANAAEEKEKKAAETFGAISPAAIHAKEQGKKFREKWRDSLNNGNLAKKARMQQNRHDRGTGKRTYVNGVGWRTKKDND
jgi:hypothetical protein